MKLYLAIHFHSKCMNSIHFHSKCMNSYFSIPSIYCSANCAYTSVYKYNQNGLELTCLLQPNAVSFGDVPFGAKMTSYRRRACHIDVYTTPFYAMCPLGSNFVAYAFCKLSKGICGSLLMFPEYLIAFFEVKLCNPVTFQ